uniref:Uncharacterized protein n=1 Tax=Poecilia reticulata TaxID=8081 RepID=A0A3P9PVU1_POERE
WLQYWSFTKDRLTAARSVLLQTRCRILSPWHPRLLLLLPSISTTFVTVLARAAASPELSARSACRDLLFSACGLSILSTIICTLSTVTCSIHIFSLDLVHLLAPHRSRSVNPECTTPQDAFLTNIMDFEEFVPPIPPPPYYPPEYTCSSETDAQSITYNGSMESPVPLYPTDCPPPYEAVMGQRAASQVSCWVHAVPLDICS